MQDEPTPLELIQAVAAFLRDDIASAMSGHLAFKLRVATNALDLVARQLSRGPDSDEAERRRLSRLLGRDGSLSELNRILADKISRGALGLHTAGLPEHLWLTTMEKLAVDQPNYASYRRELDSNRDGTLP